MNRFIIEFNVEDIAKSLCDQHIVKMPLEEAQMLCTALWHHAPEFAEEQTVICTNLCIRNIHAHCGLCIMQVIIDMPTVFTVPCLMSIHTDMAKVHGASKHRSTCTLVKSTYQRDGRHHIHSVSVVLIISRLTSNILSKHIVSSTRQTSSSLHDIARADPCLSGWACMSKYSKHKKTRREILTDLLVAVVCITIIGGMLVYAHFDIVRIVNE